ncbi:MAG: rhomboid family intramembrane serine protease [Hyphomicrobiales bacterium]|nr:MAG: rhomboid family intramembrane serine protease [Hyphomicrobiales bacterium]
MSTDGKDQQNQLDNEEGKRQPIFNLPAIVAVIAGLFLAIQAAQSLVLNERGQLELLAWFAFIPYVALHPDYLPGGWFTLLWTPVTHAFLHAGWEHVILNTVWFAIFATPLTQRYGGGRMVLLFLAGAIVGAAAFAATTLPGQSLLVGASGGVAALTGAAIRFIFQPLQIGVNRQTGERIVLGRKLATLREVLAHPTARIFTLVWLALNAVVPLLPLFISGMDVSIAWQAHLGGFVAGFFLVPFLEGRQS